MGAAQSLLPRYNSVPLQEIKFLLYCFFKSIRYRPWFLKDRLRPSCTLTFALKSLLCHTLWNSSLCFSCTSESELTLTGVTCLNLKISFQFRDIFWSQLHPSNCGLSSLTTINGSEHCFLSYVFWLEPWSHPTQGFCLQCMRPDEWRSCATWSPSICLYRYLLGSKTKMLLCLAC